MTKDYPAEKQEQDRELAHAIWQRKMERDAERMQMAPVRVRARAKVRLALNVAWALIAIGCFFVWRYMFLHYLWPLWR